jgi:hypothetical protein
MNDAAFRQQHTGGRPIHLGWPFLYLSVWPWVVLRVGSCSYEFPLPPSVSHILKSECAYRLEIRAGLRVERLPDKTSISSEFGEVTIEYSMSGDALVATQTVSFKQSRILPDKYPEFRNFVNAYIRATSQRLRMVNATHRLQHFWEACCNLDRPAGLSSHILNLLQSCSDHRNVLGFIVSLKGINGAAFAHNVVCSKSDHSNPTVIHFLFKPLFTNSIAQNGRQYAGIFALRLTCCLVNHSRKTNRHRVPWPDHLTNF